MDERRSTQEDRRAAKQSVLSKVNQVLVNAGLNDTVWSIRDCDSTLFVLMYKKLVGKVHALNLLEPHKCIVLRLRAHPVCVLLLVRIACTAPRHHSATDIAR